VWHNPKCVAETQLKIILNKEYAMRRLMLVLLFLALGSAVLHAQDELPPVEIGPITQEILDRGVLNCGVAVGTPGFTQQDDDGGFSGFNVEWCRAVATAILGDPDAVAFVVVTGRDFAQKLHNREIDLMSARATWTLTRDASWGLAFAPTVFYDGQSMLVYADSGIQTIQDMAAELICTIEGSSSEFNIRDLFESRSIEYELSLFESFDLAQQAFFDGRCSVLTTDRGALAAVRAATETPENYTLLNFIISKEPLSPVMLQSDPQFNDIVRWTLYGIIQAEELGITSANVERTAASETPKPAVAQLLGIGDVQTGERLLIADDFMVDVIREVGNYGEVYDRWFGPDTPLNIEREGTVNELWTRGGLIYSPPFR
jgi:general L-amino acid transport system substrate-binding protein